MTTTTTTIIHTVYNERTLCGKHAPIKTTCTREKISSLTTPWVSCPICTLATTCAQLDANRDTTPARALADHDAPELNDKTPWSHGGARWIQPPLFD